MRAKTLAFAAALLLATAPPAPAQSTLPKPAEPREQNAATIGGRALSAPTRRLIGPSPARRTGFALAERSALM